MSEAQKKGLGYISDQGLSNQKALRFFAGKMSEICGVDGITKARHQSTEDGDCLRASSKGNFDDRQSYFCIENVTIAPEKIK